MKNTHNVSCGIFNAINDPVIFMKKFPKAFVAKFRNYFSSKGGILY